MGFFGSILGAILAFFYEIIPSYAVAIILLTCVVMVAVLPLTIKATRSMLAMQKLAPELRKLQELHKDDRVKLNQEMMKVYQDNKITPWGGCIPILLQAPVFLILYQTIIGMTHHNKAGQAAPKYISHSSDLYHDLVAAGGKMESFGIDLAKSATADHGSLAAAIPFYVLIAVMVAVQYLQMVQVLRRAPEPDSDMARSARTMQKFFPIIFSLISFGLPAGVVVYWIFSSLFRIGQQAAMYKFDPALKETVANATAETESIIKRDTTTSGRAQKSPGKPNKTNKKRKGR